MHEHSENNPNLSSQSLVTLDFHGTSITTFEVDGKPYVSLRSLCEAIGLSWSGQFEKVKRDPVLSSVVRVIRTTGSDGKSYEMTSLPLDMVQGWFFKIDSNRVRESLKERVILFQRECYPALNSYWSRGIAVKDDLDGLITGLSPDVERLFGGIVKKVIRKALGEGVEQMIEQRLSRDPRIGAVTAVPALQVAVEQGAKRRPRGFVQRVSNALSRFCESHPNFAVLRDVYGRKLFPREAINEWLAKGGWGPMKDHLDRKGGQQVFTLVPKGGDK
ncbi:MAG: hypothetical protein AXW12_09540 [Thalassospira sp. Nap_22]|nr:MAG: hypothetical protein AXW12_09540 [Thalassospira sp. Nap_22]